MSLQEQFNEFANQKYALQAQAFLNAVSYLFFLFDDCMIR